MMQIKEEALLVSCVVKDGKGTEQRREPLQVSGVTPQMKVREVAAKLRMGDERLAGHDVQVLVDGYAVDLGMPMLEAIQGIRGSDIQVVFTNTSPSAASNGTAGTDVASNRGTIINGSVGDYAVIINTFYNGRQGDTCGPDEEKRLHDVLQELRNVPKVPPLVEDKELVREETTKVGELTKLADWIDAKQPLGQLGKEVYTLLERRTKRLEKLRQGRVAWKVVTFLKSRYKGLRLEDFGTGETLANVDCGYVELAMAEWNREAEDAALKGDKEKVSEVLHKTMKPVRIEQVWEKNRERIMVQGEAGAGKTTLLTLLAHNWSEKQLWRHKFDVVVFMRLRDVPLELQKSPLLLDLLSGVLLRDLNLERLEVLLFLKWCLVYADRVLWLLDGWDEVVVANGSCLQNIQERKDPCVKFLIAGSRPEAVRNFKELNVRVTVLGFQISLFRVILERHEWKRQIVFGCSCEEASGSGRRVDCH
jgi:hypothetical protein